MTKENNKKKIKLPDHIHLYKKIDLTPSWHYKKWPDKKPYLVFQCQKPACNHYIIVARAIGKLCECSRCHNPMILDKETIGLTTPHCQNCIVRKSNSDLDKLSELIKDI